MSLELGWAGLEEASRLRRSASLTMWLAEFVWSTTLELECQEIEGE
jgi:hypothetical protein